MRPLVLLVFGATLCACSGRSEHESKRTLEPAWLPPEVDLGDAYERSGSRLRPLAWVSDEGPRLRTPRFHDLERDEQCSFRPDDAGTLRCFPTAVAQNFWDPRPSPYPSCSGPYVTTYGAVPAYAETVNEAGCGTRLYELGPELNDDSGCGVVSSLEHPYGRGARVPNDAFVRAAESVSPRGGAELTLTQLTAEDGSATVEGFYDVGAGAACEFEKLYAEPRCVTSPVGVQSQWPGELTMDGEDCWNVVLVTDSCVTPRTGLVRAEDEARATTVVPERAVTQPRPAVVDCLAAARSALYGTRWVFGDELAPETFPALAEDRVTGQRLQATWLQDPAGAVVLPNDEQRSGFTDEKLGTTCALRTAADGTTRCLPGTPVTRYADAACEKPLLGWSSDEPPPAFASDATSELVYHVYPTRDRYTGDVYNDYHGDRRVCDPIDSTGTWYAMGPELSPDEFVRYDLVEVE